MLKKILHKIFNLPSKIFFYISHGHRLKTFGRGSTIKLPCRLDGNSNISVGKRTFIQKNSWLYSVSINSKVPHLEIGDNCVFGYNNHITCVESVVIGDSVLTANNVFISDNLHSYEDVSRPIIEQPVIFNNKVVIGSGSWLGENVAIVGASIGDNCVIGANSVVTHDIPDFSVAVGAPARIIKQFDKTQGIWKKIKDS